MCHSDNSVLVFSVLVFYVLVFSVLVLRVSGLISDPTATNEGKGSTGFNDSIFRLDRQGFRKGRAIGMKG